MYNRLLRALCVLMLAGIASGCTSLGLGRQKMHGCDAQRPYASLPCWCTLVETFCQPYCQTIHKTFSRQGKRGTTCLVLFA